MKYQRRRVLFAALACVVMGGGVITPAFAGPLSDIGGSVITNTAAQNALSITQQTSVGKSRSASGALLLNNTGNNNTGLTVYSNAGASVAQPLVRFEIDDPKWDEEVLYIHSDSPTSRGLIRLDSPAPEIEFVETDQEGATGKFEIRIQHGKFQINSRRADDTTFENKINMTQNGDLELVHGALNVTSGKVSEFSGGINITDGCIAIDGECVITSGGETVKSEPAEERENTAPSATLGSAPLSDGPPRDLDCNSYTERGALTLDHANNRLYVCNGPERGWDYTELSN